MIGYTKVVTKTAWHCWGADAVDVAGAAGGAGGGGLALEAEPDAAALAAAINAPEAAQLL